MILLALAIAAGAPATAEGWTVGRQGNPAQITASRQLEGGAELKYQVGIGTVRSFGVRVPGCGSDRGFDTPPGDAAARRDIVYDLLFATLKATAERCGIDQQTGEALLAGFDDAYAATESLAAERDAAAPAPPAADRSEQVAGWTVADVTENDERKLRMRKSVGETDLEYRVMAGVDRRMNLMVGGCGSNAMVDLPEAETARLAKAKEELDALIKDVAESCKLAPADRVSLTTGFDQAFSAIEAWGRANPVPGY